MSKRLSAILLTWAVLIFLHNTVLACNDEQTNTYVTQILFGVQAPRYQSNEKVKMLLHALYLCSEQSDGAGQDKLNYLNQHKVLNLPSLEQINVTGDELLDCSHIGWDSVYSMNPKIQENRKQVLKYTVNTVFDFGLLKELGGNISEENNSFSALLYYFHILADYLADDPNETEIYIDGKYIPPYAGQLCVEVNNNNPHFTSQEMEISPTSQIKTLEGPNRAVRAIGKIRPKTKELVSSEREPMRNPPGWQTGNGYNRCHLFAHRFGGGEELSNLVTCTGYLNNPGMTKYENEINDFVDNSHRIVIYRVTPIYKGENQLPSGIQMEACSVADSCEAYHLNVYCYNIQPGVKIDYSNGNSYIAGSTLDTNRVLPFAVYGANENNPDLLFEISKHLSILFDEQKESKTYKKMMGIINSTTNVARSVSDGEDNLKKYRDIKKYENNLLQTLTDYMPSLLSKENFFKSAFNIQ